MYPSDLTDAQWAKLEVLLREPEQRRHAGVAQTMDRRKKLRLDGMLQKAVQETAAV